MNYAAKVNDTFDFNIDSDAIQWDLSAINDRKFHILVDNRSFEATVTEADYTEKSIAIRINTTVYTVALKDAFDQLVEKLGFSNANSKKINQIKAPMPGLVLDILVKPGDTLAKGDGVLILEAMKMENVIKSEGDAVVKSIEIEKGAAVEKGQILIQFED